MSQIGHFGVFAVYIDREERERLRNAFNNWSEHGGPYMIFNQPHQGQLQFILVDPEPAGDGTDTAKIDKSIIEQIEKKEGEGDSNA